MGNKYKQKVNNELISGPYFYTVYGLKNKKIGILLLLMLVSTYSLFFLMVQTNTMFSIINVNKYFFAVILLIFLIFTLSFSFKDILKLLNKIVPIMCFIFILYTTFIILKNYYLILPILKHIISDAFSLKGITIGLIIGIKRNIFLSELLIGTTSLSSGIDNDKSENIINTQLISSYFISFIMCSLTAFTVLIFLENNNIIYENYNELLISVFNYHSPIFGVYILQIIIAFLAITTILSGFYIGISNITFLTKNKIVIFLIKTVMLIFTLCGIFINVTTIWYFIDLMMLIQIILNVYVISKLKGG